MTPDKVRAFRIKLSNVLWRQFPKADAITIGFAVNAVMRLALREAVDLATMPHEDGCVCWRCVLDLHCAALEHAARIRVAYEAEEEFD